MIVLSCEPTVEIPVENLSIGENVIFGENVRIVGGPNSTLKIGSFTKIHNNCLILARGTLNIGEACWFGERTVIDGTGVTKIGNFVGVGIGSSLYSHIEHGDVLEGSNYRSNGKLVIGDDAWLVGQCLVSPVNIGKKSMAMLGSVVVKDMLPGHVYGGNPAKDITDKVMSPWTDRAPYSKTDYLRSVINKFSFSDRVMVVTEWPDSINESCVYYNVSERKYIAGQQTGAWFSPFHWQLLAETIRFKNGRPVDTTI